MRLYLLLLLLLLSLGPLSSQRQLYDSEVYADLTGGLPVGSLLTIYVKYIAPSDWANGIIVDFFENFSKNYNRYEFHLYSNEINRLVATNININNKWLPKTPADEAWPWVPPGRINWWRFDLYKISDTKYLPFIHGFNSHVRTLEGINKVTSVHLTSRVGAESYFDKDEAFMNFRLPNAHTPKPETVLAALDPAEVGKDLSKRTLFIELASFPVKSKMKLSALMLASPANSIYPTKNMDKFFSTLFFLNPTNTWAFGMCNKYSEADKKVKLYLFADSAVPAEGTAWPTEAQLSLPTWTDCTGDSSSTDMVHMKLERPEKNTIKIRIYYKDSPAGMTCQITVPDPDAANLDGPLKAYGVQGATLLYTNL